MAELQIALLGGLQVSWGLDRPPIRLGRPGQTLLGYLVLNRQRLHGRERLACLLWEESDEERARHCLNTALWRLKKSLAPPDPSLPDCLVTAPNGDVGFNVDRSFWLDVADFERAVRAVVDRPTAEIDGAQLVALERALSLYGGELMEGCYEDWVLIERQRMSALYFAGLEWLLRHHKSRGAAEPAIEAALRLLQADPLCEDVHRELMRLYAHTGQRQRAVRQYAYCCDVLASELGVTPTAETEALQRAITAGLAEPPARAPHAAVPPATTTREGLITSAMERLGEAHLAIQAATRLLEQAARGDDGGPGADRGSG